MTEQFLEDYFKSVATKVKDINHTDEEPAFHRMSDPMDLDEFDQAVRNMAKRCCLLLEIGDGSLGEWDSQRDMPRIGLHVLNKSTDAKADINAARDAAKGTLLKIVSLMRRDCQQQIDEGTLVAGPLKAVNVVFDSNIKFSNMTAIDGNWYGKSFYFEFKAPVNLAYNPDNYN